MINLDPDLLEILACPACKSPLRVDQDASELMCTNTDCRLAYPVREDIPVLLVDEARKPEPSNPAEPSDEAGINSDAGDPTKTAESGDHEPTA